MHRVASSRFTNRLGFFAEGFLLAGKPFWQHWRPVGTLITLGWAARTHFNVTCSAELFEASIAVTRECTYAAYVIACSTMRICASLSPPPRSPHPVVYFVTPPTPVLVLNPPPATLLCVVRPFPSLDNVCAEPGPSDAKYLSGLHKDHARHEYFPRTQPRDMVRYIQQYWAMFVPSTWRRTRRSSSSSSSSDASEAVLNDSSVIYPACHRGRDDHFS